MENITGSQDQGPAPAQSAEGNVARKLAAVFAVLALLAIGEIYMLGRLSSLNSSLTTQQAQMAKQMNASLAKKIQNLEASNEQSLEELRTELESATDQMSTTEKKALLNAHYAGRLVRRLAQEQQRSADELRRELATKADQQQLGTLSQNFSAAQLDLATTKRTVGTLASDLGMARSKFGTLIATNHQDIVALQRLGMRDYYEFTLTKKQRKNVAGIGLVLKGASARHHTFSLDMYYNDMRVTRKNLAVDQPLFFAPQYTHTFDEMVVYQVLPHQIVGYISTPKGAVTEKLAARAGE